MSGEPLAPGGLPPVVKPMDAIKLLFPEAGLLEQAERLELVSGGRVRGAASGKRRSSMLRGSQEFADYRPYAHGDDTRRIDWNVFGRTRKAYVRQYWDEQELHSHLYIDVSRSMAAFGVGDGRKLLFALRLAACVGYAALCGEDRVTVRFYGPTGITGRLPSLRGRGSSGRLFQYLAGGAPTAGYGDASAEPGTDGSGGRNDTDPVGGAGVLNGMESADSDMSLPFRQPGALPNRPGSAWLFTDALFEKGLEETLLLLSAAGQNVVLVQLLSPEELEPPVSGELKLIDSELRTGKEVAVSERLISEYRLAVRTFREQVRQACAARGAACVTLDTGTPVREALDRLVRQPHALRQRR